MVRTSDIGSGAQGRYHGQHPSDVVSPAMCQSVQRVVSCIEAISDAFSMGKRVLSIIALCSVVWLGSVSLAAAIAQAQELPSNDTSLSATEPAFVQRSIEKPQAPHLLLSMVDRSAREPGALRNSAVPLDRSTSKGRTEREGGSPAVQPARRGVRLPGSSRFSPSAITPPLDRSQKLRTGRHQCSHERREGACLSAWENKFGGQPPAQQFFGVIRVTSRQQPVRCEVITMSQVDRMIIFAVAALLMVFSAVTFSAAVTVDDRVCDVAADVALGLGDYPMQ